MNDYERLEKCKVFADAEDIDWLINRVQELKKEKNHYRSVLSELKFKPTHTTTGQYTARATRMINRALKKWRNRND